MNLKLLALILFTLIHLYRLWQLWIEKKSFSNPIPANVSDIYDRETYAKWRAYSAEKAKWGLWSLICSYAVNLILLATNAYSGFASLFGSNIYLTSFAVMLLSTICDTVVGLPFEYIDDMIVEEKYGFNRKTKKTFVSDAIKNFIIGMIINEGLTMLLAALHIWLGDWLILAFAIVLFVIILLITFLFPFLTKIFNKFTPLEDGELKDKLTALLNKNGYTVRAIQVMDASRRSSKSNAYFTGFGKTKTIVLYDTLVQSMTPDEICAVFAHEMGHGLNKDTLKNQILNFVNIAILAAAAYFTIKLNAVYTDFGFPIYKDACSAVNYGFALILVTSIEMAIISPLLSLFSNWRSRKAEYRADAQAVKEGYGDELVSALKKLSKENFAHLAPSPISVALDYSHPPLSQRIEAIEREKKG